MELSRFFKAAPVAEPARAIAAIRRVGFVEGAIGDADAVNAIAGLFPHVVFQSVGSSWPESSSPHFDILIVSLDANDSSQIEDATRRLQSGMGDTQLVAVLRNADVATSRLLAREGVADVLPAPVSETALAISLERLLQNVVTDAAGAPGRGNQVVSLLKAGGGVGATALGVQLATMLAAQQGGRNQVCFADLDLQLGNASLYLDLSDSLTIGDCLASGLALDETQFSTVLAMHKSGARLLAAPRDLTALDSLSPLQVDGLISGLRRDFALTIVDLPPVWTSWTNRVLELSDRIILVTQLSVAHIHLVRRQINALALQRLGDRPLTLVCNDFSSEQDASISRKAAERAIGRAFDVVIPEDRKTMRSAINQGLQISSVSRGTKIEKALQQLADVFTAGVPAAATKKR